MKRKIKVAFKRDNKPPETEPFFYKIGRVIGRGTYGKVCLALHCLTRKLCAVKSINKVFGRVDSCYKKLANEMLILKYLRHPNIVKMYESVDIGKYHLMYMELCTGGDLLHYVRRRQKLDENYAKVFFRQIIYGLGYLHRQGIVHQDIKLENILIDNLGVVKICDFGVSTFLNKVEMGE